MKLLTHCPDCWRDLRGADCDDDECPVCGADVRDWDNYDGPAEGDEWSGGFAENN